MEDVYARFPALKNAIDIFERVPGIGPKTAQRIAMFLLESPTDFVRRLITAIGDLKNKLAFCSVCGGLTVAGGDPCSICTDTSRQNIICVVESFRNVLQIEAGGRYRGRYHVLGGVINPLEGITVEKLTIEKLLERVAREKPSEVILALPTSVEGDTTALYIHRRLRQIADGKVLRVSKLAAGLPVGAQLDYADPATISMALEYRTSME